MCSPYCKYYVRGATNPCSNPYSYLCGNSDIYDASQNVVADESGMAMIESINISVLTKSHVK